MRKMMMCMIILGSTLLGACQNSEPEVNPTSKTEEKKQQTEKVSQQTAFPYQNLLSESDQSFSLLVIAEQDEENPIEENKKISSMVTNILSLPTLDMAQKIYPELHIDSEPVYLLFDNKNLVYQTKTLKELINFLENNTEK